MSTTVDLSHYSFSGGEQADPIEDLSRLPKEDQERLVYAGIDVNDSHVGGAFMQLNHAGVHCHSQQEGLEIMGIQQEAKMLK